jgi:hypothetical protein
MTDYEGYGAGPSVLDNSGSGRRQPIKVIKYKNGKPLKPKWVTADQKNINTWMGTRTGGKITKYCPSCKKDYETTSIKKFLCYSCQDKKAKRLKKELSERQKIERAKTPAVKIRGKSKYS